MIIVMSCPSCGKRYELDGKLGGKRARCRKCSLEFRIPSAPPGASPVDVEPPTSLEEPAAPPSPKKPCPPARPDRSVNPRAPALGPSSIGDGPPIDEDTVVDTQYAARVLAEGEGPDSADEFALADPIPARASVRPPRPFTKTVADLPVSEAHGTRSYWVVGVVTPLCAVLALGLIVFGLSSVLRDKAAVEAAAALDAADGPDNAFFAEAVMNEPTTGSVRSSVVNAHSKILDEVVGGFNAMTSNYASVRDQPSLASAAVRLEEIARRMADLQKQSARLSKPSDQEFERLATMYQSRLTAAASALRAQLERLRDVPDIGARFHALLPGYDRSIAQLEKELIPPRRSSGGGAVPRVWVRVSNVDSQVMCELINDSMRKLCDSDQPSSFSSRFESDRQVLYLIFGPVADAKALASKISIGRVVRVTGNRLAIVARAPTADELKAAGPNIRAFAAAKTADRPAPDRESPAEPPAAPSTTKEPDARSAETPPAPVIAQPPPAPKMVGSGTLDSAIAVLNDLEGSSRDDVRKALDLVRREKPGKRREEVAAGLGRAIQAIDDDRFLRASVAQLLTKWAGPENVPALIRFLQVEDFFGAPEVLDYLATLKDPQCAEIFGAYLGRQREKAIKGLVGLEAKGEPEAVAALTVQDDNARKAACEVLRQVGAKAALSPLKGALLDRNSDVALAADDALDAIDVRLGAAPLRGSKAERTVNRRIDQVLKFLSEADPLFNDREPLDRVFRAIDAVPVDVRKAEMAKALERVLRAFDRGVRAEAAKRLAPRAGPENIDALIRFVKTEDFFGRAEVMTALAKLKDPRAAEAFTYYLPRDRDGAVAGLIALGSGAEGATFEYLSHKDDGARKGACDALRAIGTKESIHHVEPLVVDRNEEVVRAAEAALDAIELREKIRVGATKIERQTRRRIDQVIRALGALDPGAPDRDKVNHLFAILDRTPTPDRNAEVAKSLEPWVVCSDRGIRDEAARRLAARAEKENAPALATLLQGDDFNGRVEVMEALERIKDPRAGEALALWLQRDRDRAARCIVALGSGAERAVHKYLTHSDAGVRRKACEILKEIGTQRSIRPLELATEDKSPDVARQALDALQLARQRRPRAGN
jgi:HEAT repeat protein